MVTRVPTLLTSWIRLHLWTIQQDTIRCTGAETSQTWLIQVWEAEGKAWKCKAQLIRRAADHPWADNHTRIQIKFSHKVSKRIRNRLRVTEVVNMMDSWSLIQFRINRRLNIILTNRTKRRRGGTLNRLIIVRVDFSRIKMIPSVKVHRSIGEV